MLITVLLILLTSNAVTLIRDISILLNRITILGLIYCILNNSVYFYIINKSIGLHGGLLYITNLTQTFHIFILLICILILQLTSFYARRGGVSQLFLSTGFIPENINKKVQKIINIINIEHIKII